MSNSEEKENKYLNIHFIVMIKNEIEWVLTPEAYAMQEKKKKVFCAPIKCQIEIFHMFQFVKILENYLCCHL